MGFIVLPYTGVYTVSGAISSSVAILVSASDTRIIEKTPITTGRWAWRKIPSGVRFSYISLASRTFPVVALLSRRVGMITRFRVAESSFSLVRPSNRFFTLTFSTKEELFTSFLFTFRIGIVTTIIMVSALLMATSTS